MSTSQSLSSPMPLETALELMADALERGNREELQRLLEAPKLMPPWGHSKEFPVGQAACHRDLALNRDHPMSLAVKAGDLEAVSLFAPHASLWVKSIALEAAADTLNATAFDLILKAIPWAPTPNEGWPEIQSWAGIHYGRDDAERIRIYPFGSALEICVARGFSHGVRRLLERAAGDPWQAADRLLSYRVIPLGVDRLPDSFEALCAAMPALPARELRAELRYETLLRKRDRSRGRQPGPEADESFAALLAFAEALEISAGMKQAESAEGPSAVRQARL